MVRIGQGHYGITSASRILHVLYQSLLVVFIVCFGSTAASFVQHNNNARSGSHVHSVSAPARVLLDKLPPNRNRQRRIIDGSCGLASTIATTTEEESTSIMAPKKAPTPLSMTMDELADAMGGKGKAQACWDCFRLGVDPTWYFDPAARHDGQEDAREPLDPLIRNLLMDDDSNHDDNLNGSHGWTRAQVRSRITPRRQSQGLGQQSLATYRQLMDTTEDTTAAADTTTTDTDSMASIATIVQIHRSNDGTTKLLLQLTRDNLQVECVIIPWSERQSSTLCVSNQVGCGQGCTFCSTGRMGELRSLSADEILVQLYYASKVARLLSPPLLVMASDESSIPSLPNNNNNNNNNYLYNIDAIVFMGMGEAARNVQHVVRAATALTDPHLFQLAPRRVTISTVGPTPDAFRELAPAPAVLAWSVHATQDNVRKTLVPTTKHSMEDLRDALIQVLQERPRKLRQVMLELAMIGNINDRPEDAQHLIDFCQPFYRDVPGVKLVVNLIPWNNIDAPSGPAASYETPAAASIQAFQNILVQENILCYVRTTRGDDESAACGQLATKATSEARAAARSKK